MLGCPEAGGRLVAPSAAGWTGRALDQEVGPILVGSAAVSEALCRDRPGADTLPSLRH